MRHTLRIVVALLVALVTALTALELALRLFPALLPPSYLARFPGNGCEFFHPGILARTPVEGVLLPHLASAHHGPPPADLIELGIAPGTALEDARDFPVVDVPADALGFPNAQEFSIPDEPGPVEFLLIGDSLGVAASVVRPEGLQVALARATGSAVWNLSLAGLGPVQERWILENIGLPRKPRTVLWLYFSGNDLTASYEPFVARRDGLGTWAEAWPKRAKPRLVLPDLLGEWRRSPASIPREPLAAFHFRAQTGPRAVWFHPDYLRQLGWSRAEWEANPVWAPVQGELRAAHEACTAAGARFLFVYLPSKPEVLLPFVEPDPALARRTIEFLGNPAPEGPAEALWATLIAERGAQEALLREFCARESIPFLSARPALEAQAARGELGYLTTDTHWQSLGQAVLLEPLLAFLREQGALD